MTRTLIALALALAIAGCTAPDADPAADTEAAAFAEDADELPAMEQAPFKMLGNVATAQGRPLPGARVCIDGGYACASPDRDGGFVLPGLQSGIGEVVRIEATGYRPLLVPVDRERYDGIGLELNPVPEGIALPEGTGAIQFITSRVTAEGNVYDMLPEWTITGEDGGIRKVTGSRPIVINLEPGIYDATYQVEGLCAELSGWAGPNGHTLSFPIEAGSVTQVHQLCVG